MKRSLQEMSTKDILLFLHEQGYGAKRLSRALLGRIGYKSLHRWKAGDFKPRKSSDHDLIVIFAEDVERKLREKAKCPF